MRSGRITHDGGKGGDDATVRSVGDACRCAARVLPSGSGQLRRPAFAYRMTRTKSSILLRACGVLVLTLVLAVPSPGGDERHALLDQAVATVTIQELRNH